MFSGLVGLVGSGNRCFIYLGTVGVDEYKLLVFMVCSEMKISYNIV